MNSKTNVSKSDPDKVNKSLDLSVKEGILQSVSGSIFNTFLVPLALSFRATNFQIGLIATMQQVAATAGQIPGAKLTAHMNRKNIWLLGQLVGRIGTWIPIILLPLLDMQDPVTFIIILAATSSLFMAFRGPAWSSLMGDLVKQEIRGQYFGRRNMLIGLAGVITTLAAGFLIGFLGFSFVFLIGLAAGILAIFYFMRIYEPPVHRIYHYKHEFPHPRNWTFAIKSNMSLVVFTIYTTSFNFAVELAAPFYTVYMLKDLGFSYEVFSIIVILGAVARLASFKYWGRLNDKFGSKRILIVTGVFSCFIPFGWIFSTTVWQVVLVKIYDGFIFSGFDQVVFNYLLDVTPAGKRPQYIANYNFFAGLGIVFGTMAGAFLVQSLEGTTFFWIAGLQILFLMSFILRAASCTFLVKIKDIQVRQTDIMPVTYVMWRSVAVEPARGIANAINFSFRYAFDREAAYVKSIQKRKQKENIISGK